MENNCEGELCKKNLLIISDGILFETEAMRLKYIAMSTLQTGKMKD